MTPFTVYDLETGGIKRVGSCPQDMVSAQALEGEGVVAEQSNPRTDIVLSGVVTQKSAAELEAQEIRLAEIELRSARNSKLTDTDWTQVPDAPVDQAAWATYRQALRDLPQNTTDPREVVWPTPPE